MTHLVWSDYDMEAKIKIVSGITAASASGILFRYKDSSNYYLFRLNYGYQKAQLYKAVGGVLTCLNEWNYSHNMNEWYKLSVNVTDDIFKLYINGEYIGHSIDNTHASGAVGIRVHSQTVYINNVTVF